MEHRWGQRFVLRIAVTVQVGAQEAFLAHTENISLSGAFLNTVAVNLWPAACSVRFHLANGKTSERVTAYTVRRVATGVGVEWDEFAPRAVRRLFDPTLASSVDPPSSAAAPAARAT